MSSFILFLFGSSVALAILLPILPTSLVPRTFDRASLIFELSVFLTLIISATAIPLGFGFMYFFGGVVSPKAMRLYLYITRGKHILLPKEQQYVPQATGNGTRLKLRRQIIYFACVLAVVVSFATYLAKRKELLATRPMAASDITTFIASEFISFTISASAIIPVVVLALPYFGSLRLRSIDAGPFHTTILTTTIGASGGFSVLYGILNRPIFLNLIFYLFLFMGISWGFALGRNLAANAANKLIVGSVYSAKPSSRLVPSRIWLEFPPGRFTLA